MRDTVNVGDIVCYSANNKVSIGRVVRVAVGGHEFVIVPIFGGSGTYTKVRKSSEIVTAKRLIRLAENAKYVS